MISLTNFSDTATNPKTVNFNDGNTTKLTRKGGYAVSAGSATKRLLGFPAQKLKGKAATKINH